MPAPDSTNAPNRPKTGAHPRPELLLGIDPGLNCTGYALVQRGERGPVLSEGGVVRSTAKRSLTERVGEIGSGIDEVLEEFRPDVLAIEQVFSNPRNPKTVILMAHARGAILFAASRHKIPVVSYTPAQIKRLLTGSGRAGKEQMQHAVKAELGLSHILEPNDVADACAAALCHYHSTRIPV